MNIRPEPNDLIQLWLEEGSSQAPARILLRTAEAIESMPQHKSSGMSRFIVPSIAAAAIVAVAVTGILWASRPSGPEPGGPPASSVASGLAIPPRNMARVSPTTPLGLTAALSIVRSYPDPDFDGLTRFEYSVDQETGFGPFSVSLDPTADHRGETPTTKNLVLRFVMGEVAATFVSSAGECSVQFVEATPDVIDAWFDCTDVPSPDTERKARVLGNFSFTPQSSAE